MKKNMHNCVSSYQVFAMENQFKKHSQEEHMILCEPPFSFEHSSQVVTATEAGSLYFQYKVLLLFFHKSHGTPEFTDCGILGGED